MIDHLLKERLYRRQPVFSFEFFPPKTEKGEQSLYANLEKLAPLCPDFVSVTYGAGGSTREKTRNIVLDIKKRFGLEVMPHLTCIGHTPAEIEAMLDEYAANHITNILALRGDPPRDQPDWRNVPGSPEHAIDVVRMAQKRGCFAIGVGGYPEKHQQAPTLAADIAHLKAKVDAGASFVLTQLFLDNRYYFDFVDQARQAGVTVPIIPGVMPVTKRGQLERFRELSGTHIPEALEKAVNNAGTDAEVQELGLAYCTAQCTDLLRGGAPGLHFFTLNQSHACLTVSAALQTLHFWR